MAEEQAAPSGAYLGYVFVAAIAIVSALIFAGLKAWPLLPTVLIGAVVQILFRTVKRTWRKSFDAAGKHTEAAWTQRDYRQLGLTYLVMSGVCAMWYGVGWLLR